MSDTVETHIGPEPLELETPGASRAWNLALSEAVAMRMAELGTVRPYVTSLLFTEDVAYAKGNAPYVDRLSTTLEGFGTALFGAYWLSKNYAAPSIPSAPSAGTAALTPFTLVATATLTREKREDGRALLARGGVADVPSGESNYDPTIARLLAEAIIRAEEKAIFQGAGSNTDPIPGLLNTSGITDVTASTASGLDETVNALSTLRGRGRFPNVVFISPQVEAVWRKARVGTNAPYYFQPDRPMALAGCPVVTTYGLNGSGVIVAGDARQSVLANRLLPNRRVVQVDRSDALYLTTDKSIYRVLERVGFQVIPGSGVDSFIRVSITLP